MIRWFCRNPGLNPAQVDSIVNYIDEIRMHCPGFSMVGRTVTSITRDMKAWNQKLARLRNTRGIVFSPSGLKENIWKV